MMDNYDKLMRWVNSVHHTRVYENGKPWYIDSFNYDRFCDPIYDPIENLEQSGNWYRLSQGNKSYQIEGLDQLPEDEHGNYAWHEQAYPTDGWIEMYYSDDQLISAPFLDPLINPSSRQSDFVAWLESNHPSIVSSVGEDDYIYYFLHLAECDIDELIEQFNNQ